MSLSEFLHRPVHHFQDLCGILTAVLEATHPKSQEREVFHSVLQGNDSNTLYISGPDSYKNCCLHSALSCQNFLDEIALVGYPKTDLWIFINLPLDILLLMYQILIKDTYSLNMESLNMESELKC